MRLLCFCAILTSVPFSLSSQCTIACNDEMQINLNQDGYFVVTPALLLQGNLANCPNLGVQLFNQNLDLIGDTLTCLEAGTIVTGRLINYDNNVFCDTDLSVFDNTDPVIECTELFIFCNAPFSPDSIGYAIATDNCSSFTQSDLSFSDNMIDLDCYTTYNGTSVTALIERTWLVTDDSGNQGSCVQSIYLLTATLNSVIFPSNLTGPTSLTCSIDDPSDLEVSGEPLIGNRKINANGYCDISIIYSDQVFATCGGASTIIREWVALDACSNNTTTHDQIIELQDKIGPAIICPADLTVDASSFSCDATVEIPVAIASDECSDFTLSPSWEFGQGYGSYDNVPVGTHVLTYSAKDDCGNTASCSINITVVDNTPPTPICENSISVSLLPSGVARIFVNTFDEGSFDNCSIDRFEVRRSGQTFGAHVDFFCADIVSSPVLVQLRAYDANGLFNDCSVSVSVFDYFGPDISCPASSTLDCMEDIDNLFLSGQPNVSDACGVDTVYYSDSGDLTCGVGEIQRLWTAVDLNGNSSTCTQTISIVDTAVLDITFPDNIIIDLCGSSIESIDTGIPLINGKGCKNVLTNEEDQYFTSTSTCYSLFRTWTVIDWCSYDPNSGSSEGEYTHVQRIDVIDNTSPEITCSADTIYLNYSNDCSAKYLNLSTPSSSDCSGSTFIKNDSPYADGVDENASGTYPNGIHQIIYTAYDNCGNSSQCIQQIEVRDAKAPNLVCASGLVFEMSSSGTISIDPSSIVESVSDNCTPTNQLTFELIPNTFECDDIGMQDVVLNVVDADGNRSTCSTIIEIQDNMFACSPALINISGQLRNVVGKAVEGKDVVANGVYFTTTDSNGDYEFSNLPAGLDYTISVLDEAVEIKGISTFDLVFIARHILKIRVEGDPYKLIAMDVDNNNSVNVFDMIGIRQIILEAVTRYASDIGWKHIDANYIFTDSADPFMDEYPLSLDFTALSANIKNADFIAVKLGDVSGDGVDLKHGTVQERSLPDFYINTENEKFIEEELKEVSFLFDSEILCTGIQFELRVDPEYAQIESVNLADQLDINENNLIFDQELGVIKFSWNSNSTAKFIPSDQFLISISARGKRRCHVSDFITLSSERLMPELYDNELTQYNLHLNFIDFQAFKVYSDIRLGQNFPNPVRTKTTIPIYSNSEKQAKILITDLSGKTILNRKVNLEHGKNNLTLDVTNFENRDPLLYYTLIVDDQIIDTKKMIITSD